MTPSEFADALRGYCAATRGSVTSWGRSPERNEQVGGHVRSKHMVWLAGDVGYSPNPRPSLAAARHAAKQLGLKLLRESDHDHLQVL